MLSGARGSGKTSFIEWAKHEIQNKPELKGIAIKRTFLDAPGMIFATYVDLLRDLKGHQKFGWFKKTLDSPKVKESIETQVSHPKIKTTSVWLHASKISAICWS
jgi:hypothetical protein